MRTTTGAMGASGGAGNVVTGKLLLTNSPLGGGRVAKRMAQRRKQKEKQERKKQKNKTKTKTKT